MKPTRIAAVILAIIAIVHLLRAVLGWALVIGTFAVPTWLSVLAALVLGALAFALIRESGA